MKVLRLIKWQVKVNCSHCSDEMPEWTARIYKVSCSWNMVWEAATSQFMHVALCAGFARANVCTDMAAYGHKMDKTLELSQVKIQTEIAWYCRCVLERVTKWRSFAPCVSADSRWRWRFASRILRSSASVHPTKFSARGSLHSTSPFAERVGWNNQGSTR